MKRQMLPLSLLLVLFSVLTKYGLGFKISPTVSAATSTYHSPNTLHRPPTFHNLPINVASSASGLPFAWHPNFQAFCRGETDFCCLINAFEPHWIQDLKWDALNLKQEGFGNTAGVAVGNGNTEAQNVRRNVHQIWLSTPESRSQPPGHGHGTARTALLDRTHDLAKTIHWTARQSLSQSQQSSPYATLDPSVAPELSYLFYEPGSYYKKHMDVIPARHSDEPIQRQVSFILYLGHENDQRVPYNLRRDGGALRVYPQEQNMGFAFDVPPTPNTLVLFNSKTVPHAVLETHRSRLCIVGWLHGQNIHSRWR